VLPQGQAQGGGVSGHPCSARTQPVPIMAPPPPHDHHPRCPAGSLVATLVVVPVQESKG
jgi:hypothetical protein